MPSLRLVFGCLCGKRPGIGYLYEQSPQRHYHSGALASLGMGSPAWRSWPKRVGVDAGDHDGGHYQPAYRSDVWRQAIFVMIILINSPNLSCLLHFHYPLLT